MLDFRFLSEHWNQICYLFIFPELWALVWYLRCGNFLGRYSGFCQRGGRSFQQRMDLSGWVCPFFFIISDWNLYTAVYKWELQRVIRTQFASFTWHNNQNCIQNSAEFAEFSTNGHNLAYNYLFTTSCVFVKVVWVLNYGIHVRDGANKWSFGNQNIFITKIEEYKCGFMK